MGLEFKDVVKANPITPAVTDTPAALSSKLGPIDAAAAKLSAASYPFIKDIDWTSDLYLKPLPGVTPNQAMKGPVAKILNPVIANNLYSGVVPNDAQAAYTAF